MAKIETIEKFNEKVADFFENNIPQSRLKGDTDRKWTLEALGFTDAITTKALREFIDRTKQNKDFIERYKVKNAQSKKGGAMLKVEISYLYGMSKCLVARHKTRIQAYRDDLSQKAFRNMYAVGLSFASFDKKRQDMES